MPVAGLAEARVHPHPQDRARDAGVLRTAIQACAAACRACGDECDRQAEHHEHGRICRGICRRCEQACNDLLATIG
jgi:hypothetical protein